MGSGSESGSDNMLTVDVRAVMFRLVRTEVSLFKRQARWEKFCLPFTGQHPLSLHTTYARDHYSSYTRIQMDETFRELDVTLESNSLQPP